MFPLEGRECSSSSILSWWWLPDEWPARTILRGPFNRCTLYSVPWYLQCTAGYMVLPTAGCSIYYTQSTVLFSIQLCSLFFQQSTAQPTVTNITAGYSVLFIENCQALCYIYYSWVFCAVYTLLPSRVLHLLQLGILCCVYSTDQPTVTYIHNSWVFCAVYKVLPSPLYNVPLVGQNTVYIVSSSQLYIVTLATQLTIYICSTDLSAAQCTTGIQYVVVRIQPCPRYIVQLCNTLLPCSPYSLNCTALLFSILFLRSLNS